MFHTSFCLIRQARLSNQMPVACSKLYLHALEAEDALRTRYECGYSNPDLISRKCNGYTSDYGDVAGIYR